MAEEKTLLIEIGTEELPPSHLGDLSASFANSLAKRFDELAINYTQIKPLASPRRIAVLFQGVPKQQKNRLIQRKGPAKSSSFDDNGEPLPAAIGFARSCGVSVADLKVQSTPQGEWLVWESEEVGKPLDQLLAPLIEQALNDIPGKRMTWSDKKIAFLRPIHWILVMHGERPLSLNIWGMASGDVTYGHRYHYPQALKLRKAEDYIEALREAKVIVDQDERQAIIQNKVTACAIEHGGKAVILPELLDLVTGLVEWPVVLPAHFNEHFLSVPPEVLISSMQQHQKAFAVRGSQNNLLPLFILVTNLDISPHNIILGNERVMQARLHDAQFFYEQDRKRTLASRLPELQNMVFQKKLGSLYDKTLRMAKLAAAIAEIMGADPFLAERAAKICKADLLSEMVFEFPELQGTIGYYYALHDGEPQAVAQAISESYLPRFAKDVLPQSEIGICLALADRLDTLVGIFGIGLLPTGDKDPFALRRQALGVMRILIENALPLDLNYLCQLAAQNYGTFIDEAVVPKVVAFCFERFKAWYYEQGISLQTLDAVMATGLTEPYDGSRRVLAVSHFQTLPQAQNLAAANKRVRNILQKSGHFAPFTVTHPVKLELLVEDAEKKLYTHINHLKAQTDPLIETGDYQAALVEMASLQEPVDQFFDQVMVLTDDQKIQKNRIHLLSNLSNLFLKIADISKLAL